jgi:hypothetical protein
MENLEGIQFFTDADKLHRLTGYGFYGKGRSSFCIAIELGQDNSGHPELRIEAGGDVDGILSRHGIRYKKYFPRFDSIADPHQFFHQLFIYLQSTGGVQNDGVKAGKSGVADRGPTDFNRIISLLGVENLYIDLSADGFQLFYGGWAIDIGRNQ